MSVRRTPYSGSGGGGDGGPRDGFEVAQSRQLASMQAEVRGVAARLDQLGESARKGIGAGNDAAQTAKRVQQELKSTAKHFLREQAMDRDRISKTEQALRSAETRIAELGLSNSHSGTLTIEGESQGALLKVLKPLVHSMVAETMGRQGDLFAEVLDQLTGEVRRIEQIFDERVEKNRQELAKLRRQVDSIQQSSTAVSAKAEGALSAVEDLRVDSRHVLAAVQAFLGAQSASAEGRMLPSQAEFDDVRSQLNLLEGKVERLTEKTASSEHESVLEKHESVLEKEVVDMLRSQIESLQSDLKAGEQQLADIDIKCVAALDATVRNRKAAKKLEAKVDGAQERLDTRLDRLAAQAMQQPLAPEGVVESVPPPPPRALSAVPSDDRGSIGVETPSMLRGHAGASAAGVVGATGGSSVWEEHAAVDGQLYYYNTQTRQTTWTRPPETDTPSTTAKLLAQTSSDTVHGGAAARVAALEQAVTEERNQRMLMKEDLHVHLKALERSVHKQTRRNRKVEARVEESLVAASNRRSRKIGARRREGHEDEVDADDDDSELPVSPNSLMLETLENRSKLEQLEMALQRVELTTMRLDEKRQCEESGDGTEDDIDAKRLGARLSKVEKSVRSQATATMRELHDLDTQLRGFRTQLSSIADAGGIRLVEVDEDGRAPSIDGRLDTLEEQIAQLGMQKTKMLDALQVLQENEAVVKMTCAELADVVDGLQGGRLTRNGASVNSEAARGKGSESAEAGGHGEANGRRAAAGRDAGASDASSSDDGGSDRRLLRQTTVTVARLDSRVTTLEEDVAQLNRRHVASIGGGDSTSLGSRLDRMPYSSTGGMQSRGPGPVMETIARDFLSQSMERYGIAGSSGTLKGRGHLESFRATREE